MTSGFSSFHLLGTPEEASPPAALPGLILFLAVLCGAVCSVLSSKLEL